MYNRYIPGSNGVYERKIMEDAAHKPHCQEAPVQEAPVCAPEPKCETPSGPDCGVGPLGKLDLGDLLLLCIVLLLLLDAQEEDMLTVLITAAAFLFLQ